MPPTAQEDPGAQSETQTSSRLYVSPLNQTLTKTVLTPAQQAVATDISYHTIPTFPEKGYGYVELPVEEAQKLRRKFNGSILRGMKVRVEEAKPESKKRKAKEDAERAPSAAEKDARKAKKAKKEKLGDGVLSGIALPDGREVKRGWVQPSASEKKEKSKSKKSSSSGDKGGKKEKSQMIFRTTIPPNVVASTTDAEVKKRKDKKEKTRKHEGEKAGLATEVQEFTHSTKFPTFLRGGQVMENGSKATEFVEGKGWVDAAGEVVEEVKIRPQRRVTAPPEPPVPKKKKSKKTAPIVEDSSDLSESSSDPSSESDDEDEHITESVSEGDSEEQALDKTPETLEPSHPVSNDNPTPPQPEESAAATPPPAELAAPKPVHPLEALYKRSTTATAPTSSVTSTPRPAPILTNFSFFGEDANGEDDKDEDAVTAVPLQDDNSDSVPKTPYTRRDLESRGQRSAAPTPDTAAVGKKAPWLAERGGGSSGDSDKSSSPSPSDDDTSSDEEDEATTPKASAAMQDVKAPSAAEAEEEAPPREQTEFEKHFWEKRGEYNRSWKQRKREAKKESRQSENRRRGGGAFATGRE